MPRSRPSPYRQLEDTFAHYYYLKRIASSLHWDTAVVMPRGSAMVRGQQQAALQRCLRETLADRKVARLLAQADAQAAELSAWQQANLREMHVVHTLSCAVPERLKASLAAESTLTELAWREARANNDFPRFASAFANLLPLIREKSRYLAQALHMEPYEALMQEYDAGRTEQQAETLCNALESRLPALLQGIAESRDTGQAAPSPPALSLARQKTLCRTVLADLGFDFTTGRLDPSLHPFTEGGYQDIRVTTCYDKSDASRALLGVVHEYGHAQYDANLPVQWHTQPVGRDRGMSIHEGIALFYEMALGCTPGFVNYLQSVFKQQGWDFDAGAYRDALLRVKPGCIRVEADEVSYPAHILMRYRLEQALLKDDLAIGDMPDCWDAYMQHLYGLRPKTLREGCLQDIHWSMGLMGYFPSYAFGAMYAANLYLAMQRDGIGAIPACYDREFFAAVSRWLTEKIGRHGAYLAEQELVESLQLDNVDNYLAYLQVKYA